jgi:FkbM family methyltransferase
MSLTALHIQIRELFERLETNSLREGDLADSIEISVMTPPSHLRTHFKAGIVTEEDARIFTKFSPEMGIILDLGAHWGYMASSIRLSGTKCNILSVEAMSEHKQCLQAFKSMDPVGYDFRIAALSDKPGIITLYGPVVNGRPIYGLNSVGGAIFKDWYVEFLVSIVDEHIAKANEHKLQFWTTKIKNAIGNHSANVSEYRFQLLPTKIKSETLDSLLTANKFIFDTGKVAAIKVDVEGHEPQVLRGAHRTIEKNLPFILVEGGNRVPAVVEFLSAIGYLYARRIGDQIVESHGMDSEANGYWFHPERADEYKKMSLLIEVL